MDSSDKRDKKYVDVNLESIRIKGGDPFDNKGKSVDDDLISGVYRVRVTGDYFGGMRPHGTEHDGELYTQLAGYDIEFKSEIKPIKTLFF